VAILISGAERTGTHGFSRVSFALVYNATEVASTPLTF
jgi:hypothetical protein